MSNYNPGLPRVAFKDVHLSKIPRTVTGDPNAQAARFTEIGSWRTIDCQKCGGPVYVKKRTVEEFGLGHGWTCRDCKTHSKNLVHDACVALALRKKAMGLLK